jgi:hypothetical protein
MEVYLDVDGDSGVEAYEVGGGFIRVRFKSGTEYLYTDKSAGAENIEEMKRRAAAGDGLNAFIIRYVKNSYEERKW